MNSVNCYSCEGMGREWGFFEEKGALVKCGSCDGIGRYYDIPDFHYRSKKIQLEKDLEIRQAHKDYPTTPEEDHESEVRYWAMILECKEENRGYYLEWRAHCNGTTTQEEEVRHGQRGLVYHHRKRAYHARR